MLVLNTNEQAQGDVLSNRFLWTYPDFRSILFYPNIDNSASFLSFSWPYAHNWEIKENFPSSHPTSFDVNWTQVHVSNQILQENLLLNWTLTWWNLWNVLYLYFQSITWNFVTQSDSQYEWIIIWACRLWFAEQFQESWTVWKKIIFNCWFEIDTPAETSSNFNKYFWITYRLWLLHEDWSISYWDWVFNKSLESPAIRTWSTNRSYWWATNRLIESETNWLNYIKWDRLIIEIWWYCRATTTQKNTTSSISFNCRIYFWKRACTTDTTYKQDTRTTTDITGSSYLWTPNFRWRPIQISIE